MDLKDFISSAIIDVSKAVVEADAEIEKIGGLVNPGANIYDGTAGKTEFVAGRTTLNFDVAVTASNEQQGGAKASAKIFVVEANIGGEASSAQQSVSRMSFSIDVVLPHDPRQKSRIGKVQRPK